MGYPLVNMADGLFFYEIQGIYWKKRQQHLGTQKRVDQLSLARRGQRQRQTGHRTRRRKSIPGNTSMNNEKGGIRKKTHTRARKKWKEWDSPAIFRRWTSWSRLRATGWSHGNVLAQSLSFFQPHRRNRARRQSFLIGRCHSIFSVSNKIAIGIEYNTIDESVPTILTRIDWTKWNDSLLVRVGFYRLVQRMWLVERYHAGIMTTRGDSRGCPPWVHLLS